VILSGYRVVAPDGVIPNGWVRVEHDRIAALGASGTNATNDHNGRWLVPGFVDMHVHGGGGHEFGGDPRQAEGAAAFHLAHGTTTLLASLVAGPPSLMLAATEALRPLVGAGVLAGVHWEGPYLSPARYGAQNPAHLRPPDLGELGRLLDAGAGTIRMMTLAPELPRALDAIDLLRRHGVVAAVGHTDATYEETLAAVTAGATVGTHLYNAMRPPHHRDPGPVVALLESPRVTCELIADGVHLHDATLRFAVGVAGADRAALITDATAAAGLPNGEIDLGGQRLEVAGGVARLAGSGALAGSTLTMDAALRVATRAGLSIVDAVRSAATTPAAALGLADRGAIAAGRRADLVVLDEDLTVLRVMRAGRWIG
jgi:N-acetylglucosamine-6-phosphate deacetylase